MTYKKTVIFEALEERVLLSGTPLEDDSAAIHATLDTSSESAATVVTEVLIVDVSVDSYEDLLADLDQSSLEIHFINSVENAVDQITSILSSYTNLDALHILSHGSEASIQLGSMTLDNQNISSHSDQFSSWSKSLSTNADILLYGCNLAAGVEGGAFISSLARLTGADVAASDDITGLGGDAELELEVGSIEAEELFSQENYEIAKLSLATALVDNGFEIADGFATPDKNTLVGGPITDADGNIWTFSSTTRYWNNYTATGGEVQFYDETGSDTSTQVGDFWAVEINGANNPVSNIDGTITFDGRNGTSSNVDYKIQGLLVSDGTTWTDIGAEVTGWTGGGGSQRVTDMSQYEAYRLIVTAQNDGDGFSRMHFDNILITSDAGNATPEATANTITFSEDDGHTFTTTDFAFTDLENDALTSVTIKTLDLDGTASLKYMKSAVLTNVTAETTLTAAEIATLVYSGPSGIDSFTYTVNDASGNGTVAGTMTLHSLDNTFVALQDAINNASAGDTIDLALNVDTTIHFFSEIYINKDLTIINSGSGVVTFDGQNLTRLFRIDSADFTFTGLNFINGYADNGGAIYIHGDANVTINDATISSNTATDRGGAIYLNHTATLTINDSTISANTAHTGGAIYINSTGATTVSRSTLADNVATNRSGLVETYPGSTLEFIDSTLVDKDASNGSFMYLRQTQLILTNTTMLGADATMIESDDTAYTISNSTLYAQDGQKAIHKTYGTGNGTITNSIVKGAIVSSTATSTYTWWSEGALSGAGNITSTVADLKILALADNGGPVQTMELESGSVAIDSGFGVAFVDARGTTAVGINDLGSYQTEYVVANDVPVATDNTVTAAVGLDYTFSTTDFTYTDTENNGLVSAALSNLVLNGGTLVHSGSTTVTEGMTLTSAELATLVYNGSAAASFDFKVNDDLGAGTVAATMTINMTVAEVDVTAMTFSELETALVNAVDGQTFYFNSANAITLDFANAILTSQSFTLENRGSGELTFNGRGLNRHFELSGSVTFDNIVFDNAAISGGNYGGSIWHYGDSLTIRNSTFSNNSSGTGGAIRSHGDLIIDSSSFVSNTSRDTGAAVYAYGTLTVTNSTFEDNVASGDGGAIYKGSLDTTVTNTIFRNNTANRGAALYHAGGTSTVTGSTFESNINNNDGTLKADGGTMIVDSSTFNGNTAVNEGDAIVTWSTQTQIQNITVVDNSGSGVAVRIYSKLGDTYIKNSTIVAESVMTGLAVANGVEVSSSIINGHIVGNVDANYLLYTGSTGTLTGANNTAVSAAQINLQALADNGGSTQTMALGTGSVAIDSGTGAGVDQRGFSLAGIKDIGAFEAQIPTATGLVDSITVIEDLANNLDLSALEIGDLDGDILTLSLTVGKGTITATAAAGITIGGSGTTVTLQGTATALNTYLDTISNLKYSTPANDTSATSLAVKVTDNITAEVDVKTVSNQATVSMTVTAVNDAAIAPVASHELAVDFDNLDISGQLRNTDVDNNDNIFQAKTETGAYGTLVFAADGSYSYIADSSFVELPFATRFTDVFTILTEDGTETRITVNLERPAHFIPNIIDSTMEHSPEGFSLEARNQLVQTLKSSVSEEFFSLLISESSLDLGVVATGDLLTSIEYEFAIRPAEDAQADEGDEGLQLERDFYEDIKLTPSQIQFIESLLQEAKAVNDQFEEASDDEGFAEHSMMMTLPSFDFITELEGQVNVEEMPKAVTMAELDGRKSLDEIFNSAFNIFP